MSQVLHAGASLMCPHAGTVSVPGGNPRVKVAGQAAATTADQMTVSACTFQVSGAPQPCALVRWVVPAKRVRAGGQPLLLRASTGLTVGATQAPQGTPTVASVQTRVRGM